MSIILIVDDNLINLKLASRILESEDYQVVQKTTAEDADYYLKAHDVDLILLDIGLPGMNGLTFTKKLKSNDQTSRIPVVIITAAAMKGDAEKAFKAGCDDYITKPIDTRKLPTVIKNILERDEL